MFDTNLVVVGNALTNPEWRRIASSGSLVANFRIASTARRFDRDNNRWVDGNNLRVRVTAWRKLAEGVASSIKVGDPVIVYGRLYTRDWTDEDNNPRISYEMEAFSIGHDLARGRGTFFRHKNLPVAGLVEDTEADTMVAGEATLPVPADEVPVNFGEGLPESAGEEPEFAETPPPTPAPEPPTDDELTREVEQLVAEQPGATRRTRRSKREPVAA